MPFIGLHQFLPDLARRETRTMVVSVTDAPVPADAYRFVETYCDEPGCDCRRVMLNVISEDRGRTEAVIAYGWEEAEFYSRWMRTDDPQVITELMGPVLNLGSPATEHAPELLAMFEELMMTDDHYVARLQEHYRRFRECVGAPRFPNRGKKVGRNEKCPCGSGRKWKVCCGRLGAPRLTSSARKVGADWKWQADVARVVEKAIGFEPLVIHLDELVMFATNTGDAWLLDPAEGRAAPLARDGAACPARTFETGKTFGVEWTHDYAVIDGLFVVTPCGTQQTERITNYWPDLLASIVRDERGGR